MKSTTDVSQSPPVTHSPTHRAHDGMRTLKAARAAVETARTQLQALLALTDTALSSLSLDDLLRELLGRVAAVMEVDQIVIYLLDDGGKTLTLRATRGLLEDLIGHQRVTVGRNYIGRIAASREPEIQNAPADSDFSAAPPRLREQLHAMVGVPLLVADRVTAPLDGARVRRLVGVLAVGSTTPRKFTETDVQLLQRAADRIALAVDHALVYAAELEARHRAEAALSRALVSESQATDRAEQLHTILETIADGVAVYDAEGRPVQTNHAYRELLALERGPKGFEALPALKRTDLLHLRDLTGAPLSLARNPIARALQGQVVTGQDADLRARAFDDRELELNASAAPMRGAEGRVDGVVLVLRDLTARNQLEREREAALANEEAAQQTTQRMEAFVAAAAHDLRSPLTSTAGFITLAQDKTEQLVAAARATSPGLVACATAAHDRLGVASHNAERLKRLLGLMFDTAAIRAGKLELHRAPVDLAALVRELVDAQRVAAPGRTILLRTPSRSTPVQVEADADRLGEVVTNFVSNALKYSPVARPVYVAVEARSDRARVAVRDAGPGIPKSEQEHVWELFHRAAGIAPQGDTKSGSLGLGIYISKAIIEAHGGQVGVMSAVGTGSTFWFTLPLADAVHMPADR
jgi:signal transduction histidine kinase